MTKLLPFFAVLTILAACSEPPAVQSMAEEDEVEASGSDLICPVDVSEADRSLYPGCE